VEPGGRNQSQPVKGSRRKILDAVSEIGFARGCDNIALHSRIRITIEEFEAIDRADNRFISSRGHKSSMSKPS
jgi:hypothetical protein